MMIMKINKNNGFTLIELMIVIAIIGILAAIAIPQFQAYRSRAFNSAAQADIHNISITQEAYYVDNGEYCSTLAMLRGMTPGYMQSENVWAGTVGSVSSYTITTYHIRGNKTFTIRGPGGIIGAH
jgi:prepilin-type N-terminal cleavage/methylation domain-containing protein